MKGKIYNAVSLTIGLGTLCYMVYKIGLEEIWKNVLLIGIWFVPVIVSWLVIYLLNALAFREIIYEKSLPETRIPFGSVLRIIITGYAINYITPFVGLGGEPYRVLQLQKRMSAARATSSVLLYYIMHVFSHIVFWMVAIGLILFFLDPATDILITCFVTFAVFFFLVHWTVRSYRKGLLRLTFITLSRIPFLKRRVSSFLEKKKDSLDEIDRHIIELFQNRPGTFYSSLFFEFAGRLVGCLEIYFIAVALHLHIGFIDSVIISAGSSLFANLIFFTPMQLGGREGGFVLVLQSIGLAAGVGLLMSLATRLRELVWIFIGLLFIPVKAGAKVPQ